MEYAAKGVFRPCGKMCDNCLGIVTSTAPSAHNHWNGDGAAARKRSEHVDRDAEENEPWLQTSAEAPPNKRMKVKEGSNSGGFRSAASMQRNAGNKSDNVGQRPETCTDAGGDDDGWLQAAAAPTSKVKAKSSSTSSGFRTAASLKNNGKAAADGSDRVTRASAEADVRAPFKQPYPTAALPQPNAHFSATARASQQQFVRARADAQLANVHEPTIIDLS